MATRARLSQRLTQRLSMTADLRQGMALLALPAGALGEELARQAEDNPLLSHEPKRPISTARSAFDIASETVALKDDLGTFLRKQLGAMELNAPEMRAARAITWSLDDRGLLDATLDEIAEAAETGMAEAEAALCAVQSCDPPGVGARDLAECLALQVCAKGYPEELAKKAVSVLEEIATSKWRAAERGSGLAEPVLREIGKLLPTLKAIPAIEFQAIERAITPDLELLFGADGAVILRETRDFGAELRLDEHLAADVRSLGESHDQSNLRDYVRSGQALVRAVSFRSQTLLKVSAAIVEHQRSYLDPTVSGALAPLTRLTIASALGLHPSTVGRAITGKFLSWSGGTIALSTLFPSQLGEDGPSSFTVQQRIAELVASERAGEILSDDALASKLQREGVDIARRTVAKYRGCLGIAPSHIRKRHKARTARTAPRDRTRVR